MDVPTVPHNRQTRVAVVESDAQEAMRENAAAEAVAAAPGSNYVTPNLTSFGHVTTLDVYQLTKHPNVSSSTCRKGVYAANMMLIKPPGRRCLL